MTARTIKRCLVLILCLVSVLFLMPKRAYAIRTINSATLNGSSGVTVSPSTSVTAQVTVTTSGGGVADDWDSTSYQVGSGGAVCVDHANFTASGTNSTSFSITAPSSDGVYNVSFIAYQDDGCTLVPSGAFTLTGGITISTPTPTPTPTSTPTPGPSSTPTNTPTPTPSSGSSGESASPPTPVYDPTLSFSQQPSSRTNVRTLSYAGNAQVTDANITAVEYSITSGSEWISVSPSDGSYNSSNESFFFAINPLPDGNVSVLVRARTNKERSVQISQNVLIITTPPIVRLDALSEAPTKSVNPRISGRVTSPIGIARVEVTINDGLTWVRANTSGPQFSYTAEDLEDGNYIVRARAVDEVGNVGTSSPQTLVIDTIPPIIGGSVLRLGAQSLLPDQNNVVTLAAGSQTTLSVGTRGGVIEATAEINGEVFALTKQGTSHVWSGVIGYKTGGTFPLIIHAIDGAGNTDEKTITQVEVKNSGVVRGSQNLIAGAQVSIHYFESASKQWVLWDAQSYGQTNPQVTGEAGTYAFTLPQGKYYLSITSPEYQHVQSNIFELTHTQVVSSNIELVRRKGVVFSLPVIGKVSFVLPDVFPPQHVGISETSSLKQGIGEFPNPVPGNFSFTTLDSKPFTQSDIKGKDTVFVFLSAWSPESQEQLLLLDSFMKDKPESLSLYAVFSQDSSGKVLSLMNKGSYHFPVLVDETGETSSKAFSASFFPYTVYMKNGQAQKTHVGVVHKDELNTILEEE